MIPNTSFNVANVQVSQLPIQVSQIEGYHKGATDAWLQVHDSYKTPVNGAVPLLELPIAATAQFQETLQVARMVLYKGLFVGISSSEGTWTASANTMDITVWTDVSVISTNLVTVNNASDGTIWTEADGAASTKKLYALHLTELLNVSGYVLLFAIDRANVGNTSLVIVSIPITPLATVDVYFGDGLRPLQNTLPGTLHQGCSFYVQTTNSTMGLIGTQDTVNLHAITN